MTGLTALGLLTACIVGGAIVPVNAESAQTSGWMPGGSGPLILVGHDGVDVDPALRRYAGMVTALGSPDGEGRIYSFQAKRLPAAEGHVPNELRGWRLTILAGKRFAKVFEVQSNTQSEITISTLDGPLNGLAVQDVFIVEEIAVVRPLPSGPAGPDAGAQRQ